jgi:hypothetical protein
MTLTIHTLYTILSYLNLEIIIMTDTTVGDWLEQRFEKSKAYQTARGIRFELTFEEYIKLWSADKIRKLEKYAAAGDLDRRMRHPDKGWVLSWASKEARKAGVMNKDTARVLTRKTSEIRFFMQKGERHTEAAKKAIGDAHRGKKISEKHRNDISKARMGVKQSEEHRRKRSEAMRANWAARRAAQTNYLHDQI